MENVVSRWNRSSAGKWLEYLLVIWASLGSQASIHIYKMLDKSKLFQNTCLINIFILNLTDREFSGCQYTNKELNKKYNILNYIYIFLYIHSCLSWIQELYSIYPTMVYILYSIYPTMVNIYYIHSKFCKKKLLIAQPTFTGQ